MVATTPLPIFDDVAEAVYQLSGSTPRELAIGLAELLHKIKRNDPTLNKITMAATRLIDVTAYANVSGFLDNEMRFRSYFDIFRTAFSSNKKNVILVGGRWVDAPPRWRVSRASRASASMR